MDMLNTAKLLLGIKDDKQDGLLTLLIEETIQRILNYCNLDQFPNELRLSASRMAAELWTESQIGSVINDPDNAMVSSVSEQGRTVSFSMNEKIKIMTRSADDKISMMKELNKFKRLYKLAGSGS